MFTAISASTHDDQIAYFWLKKADFTRTGAESDDSEGLIDHIRAIEPVVVACVFEEMEPDLTRISLRSKSDKVNVNEIAAQFGGGGHPAAAGARIPGQTALRAAQGHRRRRKTRVDTAAQIISSMQEFLHRSMARSSLINPPARRRTTSWTPSAASFGIKKVGHCGTLDPNATGLLIIVLGRGTKLSEKLMSDDKVYEGTIKFGETTDSYDADGELTASLPVPPMTLEELNEAGRHIHRRPDADAADGFRHQKGRRAALQTGAQRHRGGTRAAPDSHLQFSFHRIYQEPLGEFRVACTKGTYVRSIAHDLGQKLGCGAHLATLRRIVSGKFDVADATPLDEVLNLTAAELEKASDSVFETGCVIETVKRTLIKSDLHGAD